MAILEVVGDDCTVDSIYFFTTINGQDSVDVSGTRAVVRDCDLNGTTRFTGALETDGIMVNNQFNGLVEVEQLSTLIVANQLITSRLLLDGADRATIVANHFTGDGSATIDIRNGCTDLTIIGNTIVGTIESIALGNSSDILIENNRVEAILLEDANRVQISRNSIRSAGGRTASIELDACDDCSVVGNEGYTPTSGSGAFISLIDTDDTYVEGNRYHGTPSGSAHASGLAVGSGCTNTTIRWNDFGGVTTDDIADLSNDLLFPDAEEITFTRETLTLASGTFEIPMVACTIIDVRVRLATQPTGSSVIFDVHKNGTTIFTTQANRPTVATSSNTDTAVPDVTAVADGDYVTVDIDQIDSNGIGAGATVVIRYRRP